MQESTTRTRYALVGAGMRARMYVGAIMGDHAEVAELVAIADTNPDRLAAHLEWIADRGVAAPASYDASDVAAMVRETGADRVIITSPDFTHAPHAVAAMEAGADVVVEKPLTIDEAGARSIVEAVDRTGRSVTVTFNYRYAPRNSALREVIASGAVGRVTGVHFEWMLDTQHGADYFRRWHRVKANSGGLLVHKASHHFDLVNWWIADVPSRVFASGGLRFYGADGGGRPPGDRPDRGTGTAASAAGVSGDAASADPYSLDLRSDPLLTRLYLDAERSDGYLRDRDVFSDGIDIEDDLSLVVDYVSGASMSYSLTAHAPWEGYTVAVTGTEGRVELQVVERSSNTAGGRIDPSFGSEGADAGIRPEGERLVLQRLWSAAREVPIVDGGGDHGGGDDRLLADVFRGAGDDPLARPAGYRDGLRSIAVGVAGNRSLATGLPVRIADLDIGVDLTRTAVLPGSREAR